MPQRDTKRVPIGATCNCADTRFAISLSDISCEGCKAEASADWAEDCEFVQLRIDDRIDINGRISWHEGRRAGIRFFGQIHPAVIDQLGRLAA